MTEIAGQVYVSVSRKAECYGGRRIHLRIGGVPDWLMALLVEAGPFTLEASTYSGTPGGGPTSILLGSTRVVDMADPTPRPPVEASPSEGVADAK